MGNLAPHPGTVVIAVLHTDDATYGATVTIQTADPRNPTYQRDADTILTGFQLLPPRRPKFHREGKRCPYSTAVVAWSGDTTP
jgi:hypothetical protein